MRGGATSRLTQRGAGWRQALVSVVAACLSCAAAAQIATVPPAPFLLPPVPESALWPGVAGRDTVSVSSIVFEGHQALTTAELDAIAEPFLNRPLRGLDIEELRQRITRAYVERGYVSSGAIVPADAWQDGRLRLRIVEGVVTQVRVKGAQRLSDDYLASRMVRSGEALNSTVLQERFQLLLADPLFERLNASLVPGAELGSSVVDLDVSRARPWQLALFTNNHFAPAVGSNVTGLEATLRNLTGWGDALAATLVHSGGSLHHELNWTLPLAARSTTLSARLARGDSSVVEEPLTALDVASVVTTREFTLAHPVIDQTRRRLTLGLTYAQRRNRTTLAGEPFSFVAGESTGRTEIKAWRLFQDLVLRFDRNVLALRSTFSAGRNNLAEPPLLAEQPGHSYRLWIGQAQASLAVGDQGAQVLLRGQLQRSPDHLVPLEQLSVGGRHSVRGYRENQLVRDNGHAVSAELHWPLLRRDAERQSLTLVPFVDFGQAHDRDQASSRLASVGLGLVWAVADLEGELFLARRLERRAVDTHGDLQDRGIHFSLRYRAF